MDFLGKIRPLLTDLELALGVYPTNPVENLRTILINLAPMLDEIQSLYCADGSAFPVLREQLFRENDKLAKLKMLELFVSNKGFLTSIHMKFLL